MKTVLVQIGKTDMEYLRQGIDDFTSRIKKIIPYEIHTLADLKNRKTLTMAEQINEEAYRFNKFFKPGDYIILLDERGKSLSSVAFSEFLSGAFNKSYKRILFVIGGPYGFNELMYGRADYRISLSSMTFSHQLVRLLFAEQMYRALSIIKAYPYHNE
jgi:23S rRNA (pseudouridine1915-N3)-methyltransferase